VTDFDLRFIVRDELENCDDPNPHTVAERVVKRIDDVDLRSALKACLPDWVRTIATGGRYVPRPTSQKPKPSRWTEAATQYQRFLSTRVFLGGGRWVFAKEMTAADCKAAASINQQKAEENEAWAARWDGLAKKLKERGAATIADLGPDEVQESLQ
jgi:hypothetical protein